MGAICSASNSFDPVTEPSNSPQRRNKQEKQEKNKNVKLQKIQELPDLVEYTPTRIEENTANTHNVKLTIENNTGSLGTPRTSEIVSTKSETSASFPINHPGTTGNRNMDETLLSEQNLMNRQKKFPELKAVLSKMQKVKQDIETIISNNCMFEDYNEVKTIHKELKSTFTKKFTKFCQPDQRLLMADFMVSIG